MAIPTMSRYRSLQPPAMPGAVQPPTLPPTTTPPTSPPATVEPPKPKEMIPEVPTVPRPTATRPIAPPTSKPLTPETTPPGTGETPPRPPTTRPPETVPPVVPPHVPIAPTTSPVGTGLRGETYLPGDDPRLTNAMGATDRAGATVQGVDRTAMQTGNESRYRSIYGNGQVNADSSLTGAPDRTALAMQKLKDFDAVSNETRFTEERDLGRNIAKFGRSGLQANADNFGEIQRKIAGDRGRLANELAYDVSDGDINDRFRKLDFQTGLDERNQDRNFTRTNAAVSSASNLTDRDVNDTFDKFNAADSLESRIFGEGQSNRNEYRTERGREDTAAQQTIENRLKEFEIQQQLEDAKIRRASYLAQAGGGY